MRDFEEGNISIDVRFIDLPRHYEMASAHVLRATSRSGLMPLAATWLSVWSPSAFRLSMRPLHAYLISMIDFQAAGSCISVGPFPLIPIIARIYVIFSQCQICYLPAPRFVINKWRFNTLPRCQRHNIRREKYRKV